MIVTLPHIWWDDKINDYDLLALNREILDIKRGRETESTVIMAGNELAMNLTSIEGKEK